MKPVAIYGSRDYSNIIKRLLEDCNRECLGCIDDFFKGEDVIGTFEEIKSKYEKKDIDIALGVGYSNLSERLNLINKIKKSFNLATLIHPRSYVAKNVSIGEGSVIMAGAHIDYNVCLGEGVVCWPSSTVNHDTIVGDNTFISPSAVVCGFVNIGHSSFIGANSTIVEHTYLKESSFIKANSLIFDKMGNV